MTRTDNNRVTKCRAKTLQSQEAGKEVQGTTDNSVTIIQFNGPQLQFLAWL